MKKRILIIVVITLVIFILFLLSRVYNFIILNKVYKAVEKFKESDNRYYSVTRIAEGLELQTDELIGKNRIEKYTIKSNNLNKYCNWVNYKTQETRLIDFISKTIIIDSDLINEKEIILINSPKLLSNIFLKKGKVDVFSLLRVKYVIPIKYNDELCYKIAMKRETLIVSAKTFLPLYESRKIANSERNEKDAVEYIYEFKVGEVSDEDIAFPDLTGYTKIDK